MSDRTRRGSVYAKAALIGVMAAMVCVLPVTYLYITKDIAPTKVETVKVPDLQAALVALGDPAAQGTLADFGADATIGRAPCVGWATDTGFLLDCQLAP